MGTITVYFKPITIPIDGQNITLPDNHLTVVWTNDEGQQFYVRGGPSAGAGFGTDANASGSSGISSGGAGPNYPFGSVYAQSGTWAPVSAGQTSGPNGTPDWQPAGGNVGSPPPQVVLTLITSSTTP